MSVALVTGARGFAGAWLARALLERGDRVVSLDKGRPERPASTLSLLGIEADVIDVVGDLCDGQLLRSVLRENRVTDVYHLAAEPIVGTVAASPLRGFETNIRGTWTLLDACLAEGAERVVVASSDKAYGAHETLPYREDFALNASAPYEASKAAADVIARSYWHSYGLPVAVTRFANIYGGGDLNFSRLIPEAVCAALDGRPPVLRSDGSPERDFLYVEDAAAAYLAIADELDREEVRGEAFNAGERATVPGRRGGRDDRQARRYGRRARSPGGGEPGGRDRPPVRRPEQAAPALRMGAVRDARGRPRAHDRVVPRAPRRAARRLNGSVQPR